MLTTLPFGYEDEACALTQERMAQPAIDKWLSFFFKMQSVHLQILQKEL